MGNLTRLQFPSSYRPKPRCLWSSLSLLFRERRYRRLRSGPLLLSYLVLLRVGFTLPRASLPERCALTLEPRQRGRTFSPLPVPDPGCPGENLAVCFLWHFPYRRRTALASIPLRPSPLASTLPCGVRTFLSPAPANRPRCPCGLENRR